MKIEIRVIVFEFLWIFYSFWKNVVFKKYNSFNLKESIYEIIYDIVGKNCFDVIFWSNW